MRSEEIFISCLWNEKVFYDQYKIKTKSLSLSEKEFFYINTDFKFFGTPRSYNSLSDPDNDFNKHDIFEFKNGIFFKLSDLSLGKRKHYFTTKYNRKNGEIIDIFVNTNPSFGKVQSTKKQGSCKEVVFRDCSNEKLLICVGDYSNINKVTKEIIKYETEKNIFFVRKKNFYPNIHI